MCFMHSLSESQKCPILIPCKTAAWRVGLISGKNDKIEVVHFQPYPASLCPFSPHRDAVKHSVSEPGFAIELSVFDFLNLFIHFCLRWVSIGVQAFRCRAQAFPSCGEPGLLSRCGVWTSHCSGFFSCRAQALGCVDFGSCSTCVRSVFAVHRLSCPLACRIFLDQGSNLWPLHRQTDPWPPRKSQIV